MNDAGKVIGILALLAAAAYAVSSYASVDAQAQPSDTSTDNLWNPFAVDAVTPDVSIQQTEDAGIDMSANWKVNEYPKYADAIASAERQYNIPTDLLARLLYQESRFRTDIITGLNRSPVGAVGIAQFMPGTAAQLGVDRLDPVSSIYGAAKYLKQMYDKFNNWTYALMAYNWGPGNVSKWLQGTITTVPQETQTYWSAITADVPVA